jgi:hypothetical protein
LFEEYPGFLIFLRIFKSFLDFWGSFYDFRRLLAILGNFRILFGVVKKVPEFGHFGSTGIIRILGDF